MSEQLISRSRGEKPLGQQHGGGNSSYVRVWWLFRCTRSFLFPPRFLAAMAQQGRVCLVAPRLNNVRIRKVFVPSILPRPAHTWNSAGVYFSPKTPTPCSTDALKHFLSLSLVVSVNERSSFRLLFLYYIRFPPPNPPNPNPSIQIVFQKNSHHIIYAN